MLETVRSPEKTDLPGLADGETVLVVNAGSSSLKLQFVPQRIGVHIERIGAAGGVADHREAFRKGLAQLKEASGGLTPVAVGHRVVHGGDRFREPTLITETVLDAVGELSRIAPLHNPAGLQAIAAAREELPDVPHVGVFDTAFHATMPEQSYLTGLPWSYYEEQGIRNYGFHGTNHDYVTQKAAELLGRPRSELKLISLHLGNGASAAAVRFGRSFDTSMGFTPLAGLLMGSRTGDLDPGIILHLLRGGMEAEELAVLLNRESGLKGLSGISNDLRDIRAAAAAGNHRARAALGVYTLRIIKATGAEAAAMEGVDAIIFTGGAGENDTQLRADVLGGMGWLGVELDRAANAANAAVINTPASRVKALVIPADEEGLIARQVLGVTRTEAAAW